MSQALIDAVQDGVENGGDGASGDGTFDISADVFEGFDARLENLHWREDDEGALLVGNSRSEPDTLVRVVLLGTDLSAERVAVDDVDWDGAREISRPESRTTPQYD